MDRFKDFLVFVGTWSEQPGEGIYTYRLDPATGDFGLLRKELTDRPFHLTLSRDQRFLYATSSKHGNAPGMVVAYAIEETGVLRRLNQQPTGGSEPCYVCVDGANSFLIVANYRSGSVTLMPLASDGSLGPSSCTVQHQGTGPVAHRQSEAHPHCFQLGPGDRFAYAPDLGADRVFAYEIDDGAGTLRPTEPAALQPGAGPRHINFHPDGRFAYVINELDSTINVFDWDPQTGHLTQTQSISALPEGFSGSSHTADVQIHPNGRFAYGTNRGHDSIATFTIDESTGSLSMLDCTPAGGQIPWNIAIAPDGHVLTSANHGSNNVTAFSIDTDTGLLQPLGSPAVAASPTCVRILQR